MARTSVIFSLAFTGLILLSITHVALGVSKLTQALGDPIVLTAPGGLATLERNGKDESNLPEGEVNRGGTIDLTAVDGLARVNDGGGVSADLKKGEVKQGPKYEHVEIANGAVSVKRSSEVTVDLRKGKVAAGAEAEAVIPGVANVAADVKDVPEVKKNDGNYK
ncbi:hypothetical protein MKW94_002406 [Papaver nudicaule]|uniref:Uncharacterized protein n=1 Tax=Papaver nudicaule TaxID=74823 RepID=A0AA41VRX1_PAPNU|nr:hypothetical protein [Papaver nudicaule]